MSKVNDLADVDLKPNLHTEGNDEVDEDNGENLDLQNNFDVCANKKIKLDIENKITEEDGGNEERLTRETISLHDMKYQQTASNESTTEKSHGCGARDIRITPPQLYKGLTKLCRMRTKVI